MTDASNLQKRRSVIVGLASLAALAGGGAWAFLNRPSFGGTTLTPPEVLQAARDSELLLIDIRRPDEWAATGIAPFSRPLDMRREDFMQSLRALSDAAPGLPVALICARGVRSRRLTAVLTEAGFSRIVDVPEGMLGSAAGPGWLARGLPVVRP